MGWIRNVVCLAVSCTLLCFQGCQPSINTVDQFQAYINTPANGLIKTRIVGGLEFSLKYIPETYLKSVGDLQSERDGVRFLFKIAPSQQTGEAFDVLTQTVSSSRAFKEKNLLFNFGLQNYLTLRIDDQELKPVLVEPENTYELKKHRLINVVFPKENINQDWNGADQIDIVFRDVLYDTGIHHFVFDLTKIKNIPPVTIQTESQP